MKTWELGSHPQDIKLILTVFPSRQPPCCLMGSSCSDSSYLCCVMGEDRKDVFPKSPMLLSPCLFAACNVPEVNPAAPFH